jgi:transposase
LSAHHKPPCCETPQDIKVAALAYAESFGPAAAAKKFGVSSKSVNRWKKVALSGINPVLTQAVAGERAKIAEKCEDILTKAVEIFVNEGIKRAPAMTTPELAEFVKITGELHLAKDNLKKPGVPYVSSRNSKPNYEIPEDKGSTDKSVPDSQSGRDEPESAGLHSSDPAWLPIATTFDADN